MDTKKINDEQLLLFLMGEADPILRQEVIDWLSEDPAHQHDMQKLNQYNATLLCAAHAHDIKGNLKTFKHRIRPRRKLLRYWTVAASILLLLGIGWIFMTDYNRSPEFPPAGPLSPGRQQARLFISDHDSISINPMDARSLEQKGFRIEMDEQGRVIYKRTGETTADIALNRLVIPRGGEYFMQLEDGTRIWLNADTELKYPPLFSGNERVVELKGEAYFEVAANPSKAFLVKTGDIAIRVYGTGFNIHARNDGKVETVLVEGSVAILHKGKETLLRPDQLAEYRIDDASISIREVDTAPYTAWKEGLFIFRQERLESIMEKLALWYDLEVRFEEPELKEVQINATLKRDDQAEKLFRTFETAFPLRFNIDGKTVIIGKK